MYGLEGGGIVPVREWAKEGIDRFGFTFRGNEDAANRGDDEFDAVEGGGARCPS